VSLAEHAAEVRRRVQDEAQAGLARLGLAYADFAAALGGERRLLRRRCFYVVPADPGLSWADTRAQLASRCDDLAEGLGRLGMPAERLTTDGLVALEAASWRPGEAWAAAPWAVDGPAPEGVGAHDLLRRSAALEAVLAGLFPAGAGATLPRGVPGAAGAAGRLLVRALVPRPLRPARLATWLEGGPSDPEELALLAPAETLPGRLAPAAVRAYKDAVVLEDGAGAGEASRTLALTAYPRTLLQAWLTPLATLDAPVDLSVHVAPKEDARVRRSLENRQARLQAVLNRTAQEGATPDPDVQVAVEDLARLRDALARRQERLFDVAIYLRLRAPTRPSLGTAREGLQARVQTAVSRLGADTRVLAYQQPQGFRAVLPEAADDVRAVLALDTGSLARTLPFVVGDGGGSGVLVGIDRRTGPPVLFDLFDPGAPNASLAVVAPAGSGKSYLLKLLLLRHRMLGVEALVLDPEGEYRRLCAAVGGQLVRFSVSRGSHLNPFDLPPVEVDDQTGERSDPVAEQTAALGGLLELLLVGPDGAATPEERAALDRAILEAYRTKGIEPGKPETLDREPPLLADLYAALRDAGTAEGARLAGLLDRYVAGPFRGLFDRPTDVRLDRPFVLFDVQDLYGDDRVPEGLRAAVIRLVTAHVWRTVRRERRPRLFVADEAATLLEHPDSARFVGNVARRCRKYWLGLCVAVQRLDHLRGRPEGLDVLANAGAKFLLGHRAEDVGPVVDAFGLSDADRADLVTAPRGHGLFLTRAGRAFVEVLASPEEHRLYTTRPDEVATIEAEERAARDGHAPVAPFPRREGDGGGGG
jgi:hypothetical protein